MAQFLLCLTYLIIIFSDSFVAINSFVFNYLRLPYKYKIEMFVRRSLNLLTKFLQLPSFGYIGAFKSKSQNITIKAIGRIQFYIFICWPDFDQLQVNYVIWIRFHRKKKRLSSSYDLLNFICLFHFSSTKFITIEWSFRIWQVFYFRYFVEKH